MKRWLFVVLGVVAMNGCALGGFDDTASTEATTNECEQDSDCGEGGVCSDGACKAREARFDTVLLEVTPPTNSGEYGGVRFLSTHTGMLETSHLDLSLGEVPQVFGTVTPAASCAWQFVEEVDGAVHGLPVGSQGTIPVKITLTPTERVLGLSAASYTARTKLGQKVVSETGQFKEIADCAAGAECEQWFSLRVPPGSYDVYIEPANEASECAVSPQLLLNQTIQAGDVEMPLTMPEPQALALSIHWPSPTGSLEGWTVDMVDPATGRTLSDQQTLSTSVPSSIPDVSEYNVTIAYLPVRLGSETYADGQELVRLAPPEGVAAPIVLLERATLELFSVGDAQVDALNALPEVVTVEGFVESKATSEPVGSGTITFIATEIASSALEPGTLASYVQSVELTKTGKFSVPLLAGTYKVQTVPPVESGLAAQERMLEVGADSGGIQAGMLVQLDDSAELSGHVVVPSGNEPLAGASVQASAAPRKAKVSLLESVLRGQPLVPRATGDVVSSDGAFTLLTDPGVFDLSVRPPQGTGFAWLVRPNVQVSSSSEGTNDLGVMKMPLPVSYTGNVSASGGRVISSALIRAYLYMGTDGYVADRNAAKSVVQVAEARADEEGNFSLLLPSRLNP